MITAITLAYKLIHEKDFYIKYINFLKNGTEKPAVEILKEIGVDLTTDKPFETAFKFIHEQLEEYKSLCK
jgi:oligoendopeptidase F